MRLLRNLYVSLLSLTLLPLLATAQTTTPPAPAAAKPAAPTPPFPGYLNDYLRTSDVSWKVWDIGVNVRGRLEDKNGAGTTDAGSNWDFSERPQDDTHNQYELLRIMPRVGYTQPGIFSVFIEGRSSYSFGDERYQPTAAGFNLPENDGPLDLYQAYITIGGGKDQPFSAKIGRQELVYGDQRLVGHARWLNVPRTFDAIKGRYETPSIAVDVFTSGVVYVVDDKVNKSNSQDLFSGVYVTLPKIAPKEIVETYLFSRNVARGIVTDDWSANAAPVRMPAPQDLYNLGLRVKSKPNAYGPWDYTVEMDYQFGSRTAVFPGTAAAALLAPRLDQSAYAFIGQIGYTWPKGTMLSPRLALYASLASGDKDPTDGKSGTFQNLFPSNHLLYGAFDLTGLQNARDLRLSFSIKPDPKLTLSLEANLQSLDTANDFWYNAAGAPRNFTGAAVASGRGYRINPSYSTSLGKEIDALASYALAPAALLELGVSHYFRGDYVKQSLSAVGSQNASYVYLQLTLNL